MAGRAWCAWLLSLAFACHRDSASPKAAAPDAHEPPTVDAAEAPAGEARSTARGKSTRLELWTTGPTMTLDGPSPESVATLRKLDARGAPGAVLGTWHDEAEWELAGYSPALSTYVVLVHGVRGASSVLLDVVTITESGVYAQGLVPRDFYGVAAVPSPDGTKIALVASAHGRRLRLHVFDVASSTLTDVGPAPSPPPDGPGACDGHDWGWADGAGIARYRELEPEIVRFEDGALVVSYGADTCEHRAKTRSSKTYPLKRFPQKGSPTLDFQKSDLVNPFE